MNDDRRVIRELRLELEARKAAAAAMREALEHARCALAHVTPSGHDGDEDSAQCDEDCALCDVQSASDHLDAALATDAGAQMLERVRALEDALQREQRNTAGVVERARKAEASRDDLIALVRKLEAERDDLRAKLRVVETPATDVWIWSGDRRELATDESTLTCPVVMRADKARELVALVCDYRADHDARALTSLDTSPVCHCPLCVRADSVGGRLP